MFRLNNANYVVRGASCAFVSVLVVQLAGCAAPKADSPSMAVSSSSPPTSQMEQASATFVCDDDIDTTPLTGASKELADTLWSETLAYLRGFNTALTSSSLCLDSARATVQTNDGTPSGLETRCVSRYRDVQLMVKHVDWVLANPGLARQCFDTQKNYKAFPLYSPTDSMKSASKVAKWLDRPTLNEYYADKKDEIGEAGRKLLENFEAILSNTSSAEFAKEDITYNGLPDLWASVGWLPFYATAEKAINTKFRGGYAYAEVMGPWGLLRIKEIEGESVGAEIGMTIQAESFYPYHFHHSQELYMNIGRSSCAGQNQFMVMNWDNPSFKQTKTAEGWDVTIDKGTKNKRDTWFRSTSPSDPKEWIAYYERNAIHATRVGQKCGNGSAPAGFSQVWARTSSRDNNQTTQVCVPVDPSGTKREGVASVGPDDRVVCHLENWKP